MSCHSTPQNIAITGYCSAAYGVDPSTAETEFHWLKKVARDRGAIPPDQQQWQDFLDQQARWIAHDDRLTTTRKAQLAERIAKARDNMPDAQSFYALEHLPSRIAYVTDATTVRGTLMKVQEKTDGLSKSGTLSPSHPVMREVALDLRRAEACLNHTPMPAADDLPDHPDDVIDEILDTVESIDVYLLTPMEREHQANRERVYQAHRWIANAYRRLRRPLNTAA